MLLPASARRLSFDEAISCAHEGAGNSDVTTSAGQMTNFDRSDERLTRYIAHYLPWSPLDFVRGIDSAGDRELYLKHLRSGNAADDLSFLVPGPSGGDLAVALTRLAWDSAFFGYGIARLHGLFPLTETTYPLAADYQEALATSEQRARAAGITYLFAQVDARDLPLLRALGLRGFGLIETRAYYHRSLSDFAASERYPVRMATEQDVESLSQTAQDMVNIYDRFHADPFIPRADADRLMRAWIRASVCEGFADGILCIDSPRPNAFCSVRFHQDKWPLWRKKISQPVLSAVATECKGWYRKIISELTLAMQARGAEHAYMVTQVTNKAVIWVWESLGYRFGKVEHVFRKVLSP
jgi:hypothetical protein